jgi:hypothetical protein
MTKRQIGYRFGGGLVTAFYSQVTKISRRSTTRIPGGQGSATV